MSKIALEELFVQLGLEVDPGAEAKLDAFLSKINGKVMEAQKKLNALQQTINSKMPPTVNAPAAVQAAAQAVKAPVDKKVKADASTAKAPKLPEEIYRETLEKEIAKLRKKEIGDAAKAEAKRIVKGETPAPSPAPAKKNQPFFLSMGSGGLRVYGKTGFQLGEKGSAIAEFALELVGLSDVIRRVAASIKESTFEVARMKNQAGQTGMTTQAFQEVNFMSKEFMLNDEQTLNSYKFLQKHLGSRQRLAQGAVSAYGVMEGKPNPAQTKLLPNNVIFKPGTRGELRDTSEIMESIADYVQKEIALGHEAKVASEMMSVFDEAGTKLIPMLSKGGAEMRRLRLESHELGLVLDDSLIEKADMSWKQMRRFDAATKALFQTFSIGFADGVLSQFPSLNKDVSDLQPSMLELGKAFGDVARHVILFGQYLTKVSRGVAELAQHIPFLGDKLTAANIASVAFVTGLGKLLVLPISRWLNDIIFPAKAVAEGLTKAAGAADGAKVASGAAATSFKLLALELAALAALGFAVDDILNKVNGDMSVLGALELWLNNDEEFAIFTPLKMLLRYVSDIFEAMQNIANIRSWGDAFEQIGNLGAAVSGINAGRAPKKGFSDLSESAQRVFADQQGFNYNPKTQQITRKVDIVNNLNIVNPTPEDPKAMMNYMTQAFNNANLK